MKDKSAIDEYNFPLIRAIKKPSFDIPLGSVKDIHDLTPHRKRDSTYLKTMTIASMPMIGFDDNSYKVSFFFYI